MGLGETFSKWFGRSKDTAGDRAEWAKAKMTGLADRTTDAVEEE